MYIAIEQPEAEFLNERGLPDGNIYNVHGGSWTSDASVAHLSTTENGNGTATVVWRGTAPYSESLREFLRLQIRQRP